VSQKELNLGILAHVDAGKTSLTERLLYEAGVIRDVGSVDAGTTQTDSLALERARGITIRSAVTSFALADIHVNLIDTPGHPDFIAEVERVLGVLDGAVLVISAVEGVQPQTRILMRALQRLRIPTLIFINKIDRAGADDERVLEAVSRRLTTDGVQMGTARRLGTRDARFRSSGPEDSDFRARLTAALAENDERILAAYVNDESPVPYADLRAELAAQTRRAAVYPIFFGSAMTGEGVEPLMTGIAELLPASEGDPDDPTAASVFKIERGSNGEKIALVRLFSGTIRTRDRLQFGPDREGKVTALAVFDRGPAVRRSSASAGAVAKLWGLADIQVGDAIGDADGTRPQFPPPTLESVVVSRDRRDRGRLREALTQLAEQDPLIDVRQDDARQEMSVSLYGDVQKEVIEATLASDYGIEVTFREATTIHIERLVGTGTAFEVLYAKTKTNVTGKSSPTSSNPFPATLGLRVAPALRGVGIEFRLDVDVRLVPLYIFKTVGAFIDHMGEYIRDALQEGLFGWQVTDCTVTLTDCGYRAPGTTAGDFRRLTPLVLMRALERAGTTTCEPMLRVRLELPTPTIGAVAADLARIGVAFETLSTDRGLSVVQAVLPAGRAQSLQRELPGLTGGEGVLESSFAGYRPVTGPQPTRRRTTPDPLKFEEYMLHLARRRPVRDEA
jgi:ribosomal protection tetracycline resistance protein